MNIDLAKEEISILLKACNHCLSTCQEGGSDHQCPDCQKLQQVMNKLEAGVNQ